MRFVQASGRERFDHLVAGERDDEHGSHRREGEAESEMGVPAARLEASSSPQADDDIL
jgi:hypothetical protein